MERLSGKEPILHGLLASLFQKCGTLNEAVAAVLVNLLQAAGVGVVTLKDLFAEALSDDKLVAAIARDLQAVRDRDPACTTYLHALLNYKGFQALQAYRIAHRLWNDDRVELASWVS